MVGAPQAGPSAASEGKIAELPVRLPDPSSTGVRAAPVPAAPPAAAGAAPAPQSTEKPSESAADIIKNYMQRRVNN